MHNQTCKTCKRSYHHVSTLINEVTIKCKLVNKDTIHWLQAYVIFNVNNFYTYDAKVNF